MTPTPRERPLSTARELLDSATAELAPKPHANPLVPLVADGAADRRALAALALEQCRVIPADRRSFLHLAARSADAGLPACAAFFAALAEGEEVALDRLGPLLTACGVDAEQAAAYVPTAGCQAYPAYVAWLALNAEPADAVLALQDATLENGCPWIAPGLQQMGTLEHRPTDIGLVTNLVITTDRRAYTIKLVSRRDASRTVSIADAMRHSAVDRIEREAVPAQLAHVGITTRQYLVDGTREDGVQHGPTAGGRAIRCGFPGSTVHLGVCASYGPGLPQ